MANAAEVAVGIALNGLPSALGGLGRLNSALGTVGGGVASGVGGVLAGIGTAVVAAGAAGAVALGGLSAAVGKTGVDFLAMKEQALVAFTTLLGSGQKATAFLDQVQQLAATTPFEFPDLVTGAQRLLAMGFSADRVLPTLTAIGDAVAAMGGSSAQIDRVTLAFGQMQAKGRVQGDEMLQLAEAGIPAWRYLAEAIGTDIPTAMKRVTKGQIDSATGIAAITKGMQKDFGGAMAAQSTTWNGLISSVKDYARIMAGSMVQPVFDRVLKPGLLWVTSYMAGPGQAAAKRFGDWLATGLSKAGDALGVVRRAFNDFRGVLGGAMGSGGIGGQLAVGFLLIKDTITTRVLPALRLLWSNLTGGGGPDPVRIIMGIVGAVETVGRWFQLGVDAVVTFKQALAGVWTLNGGGNDFVNMIGRIGLAFRDLKGAFDAGGWSAFFGTLWTGYVQPALGELWTGITTWISTNGPGIAQQLGIWGAAFMEWAGGIWSRHIGPGLVTLWTNFNTWIGQQVPLITGKLAEWGAAFGTWAIKTGGELWQKLTDAMSGKQPAPVTALGQGLLGDMNGVVPSSDNGGIASLLNTLNSQIMTWGATTGRAAMLTAFKALFLGDPNNPEDQGGIANALNTINTQITTWGAGPGHDAMVAALANLNQAALDASPVWLQTWGGLWDGIKSGFTKLNDWLVSMTPTWLQTWDNLGAALPDWAKRLLGIDVKAPGGTAPSGPPTPSGTPPGWLPAPNSGGGGASLLSTRGTGGGGPATLVVQVYGVTPQAIAGEIYDALAPLLGESGGGGGTSGPATPATLPGMVSAPVY